MPKVSVVASVRALYAACMSAKLLNLPSVKDIEQAIRERRGELGELREMLRLARIREVREAAGYAPRKRKRVSNESAR